MEDQERARRIQDLFHRTLEKPQAERSVFLTTACEDDVTLYEEVASLINADPGNVAFLERPVGDLLGGDLHMNREGEVLDQYRLIRELGRGGHGSVYLAEQIGGDVARQVAIKFLKKGMDTDEIVRRFRSERQILASLKHPFIPHLYAASSTEDGRLYFVMEYVEGIPINKYCKAGKLSIDQRLGLFRKVCAAVQYAHQHFVVHRDLKPSNVLVTEAGEPKLLDFGIAKVLSSNDSKVFTTGTAGLKALTPAYASPEQLLGESITAATDVYSLGVLLYELLVEARPYQLAGRSDEEVRRLICDQMPLPPSVSIASLGSEGKAGGDRAWENTLRGWEKRLHGDLDTIVLMALRKEPERRYATAEQFSEDLDRFLKGLPVKAQKDTLPYRIRKFVRRHRISLSVTLVVVLSILGLGMSTVWQQRQAELERDRAKRVTEFLIELFEAADPYAHPAKLPTTRELLDNGASRVEQDLQQQPQLRANVQLSIGQIYRRLGLYSQATEQLKSALPFLDTHSEDRAEALSHLGLVAMSQGDFDLAQERFDEVVEIHSSIFSKEDPRRAVVLSNLANLSIQQGDFQRALKYVENALRLHGSDASNDLQEQHAAALTIAGHVQQKLGNYNEARVFLDQSLALKETIFGAQHPSVADTLNSLGLLRRIQGDYAEAEAFYRRALEVREQVLGPEHPRVATALNNLSVVYSRTKRFDEAEGLMLRAIAIKKKLYRSDHPSLARSLHNLGRLYRETARYKESEKLYREALAMYENTVGSQHPSIASTLNNLATCLYLAREFEEAEQVHLAALAMRRRIFGQDHPDLAESMQNLGALYSTLDRYSEALPLLKASLRIREVALGEEHRLTVLTREQYGAALKEVNRSPDGHGKTP